MKLFFDGGCIPNPGEMEWAVVSECGKHQVHHTDMGYGTNNKAEWYAILVALEIAMQEEGQIEIIGDSQLVINQASGQWKVNAPDLKELASVFKEGYATVKHRVTLKYIPRKKNLAGIFIEHRQKSRPKKS